MEERWNLFQSMKGISVARTIEVLLEKVLGLAGIRSHYLETALGRHHYYELSGEGSLPTIVLIHGIAANASSYAPLMLRLRKEARRIIALDLPGHGLSDALPSGRGHRAIFDAGITSLRSLLDEPSIVFGNSMGGAFALDFAHRFPEWTSALILSSPAGTPMADVELEQFLRRFELQSYRQAYHFARNIYGRPPWYTFLMAPLVQRVFASHTVRGILEELRPREGVSRQELHSLTMPILFLWGQAERLMPATHLSFYRENLPPHAHIEQPVEFGHCPQMEYPDALCERMLLFLRENHERVPVSHLAASS